MNEHDEIVKPLGDGWVARIDRTPMYDAGVAAVQEEWAQLGWDDATIHTFVEVILDEALENDAVRGAVNERERGRTHDGLGS